MRVDLNCPFSQKDKAKALGAKWDGVRRTWYVIDPPDLMPFSKWLNLDQKDQQWVAEATKPSAPSNGQVARQKKRHAPMVTGPYDIGPGCGCNALPWEDCEHTVH